MVLRDGDRYVDTIRFDRNYYKRNRRIDYINQK